MTLVCLDALNKNTINVRLPNISINHRTQLLSLQRNMGRDDVKKALQSNSERFFQRFQEYANTLRQNNQMKRHNSLTALEDWTNLYKGHSEGKNQNPKDLYQNAEPLNSVESDFLEYNMANSIMERRSSFSGHQMRQNNVLTVREEGGGFRRLRHSSGTHDQASKPTHLSHKAEPTNAYFFTGDKQSLQHNEPKRSSSALSGAEKEDVSNGSLTSHSRNKLRSKIPLITQNAQTDAQIKDTKSGKSLSLTDISTNDAHTLGNTRTHSFLAPRSLTSQINPHHTSAFHSARRSSSIHDVSTSHTSQKENVTRNNTDHNVAHQTHTEPYSKYDSDANSDAGDCVYNNSRARSAEYGSSRKLKRNPRHHTKDPQKRGRRALPQLPAKSTTPTEIEERRKRISEAALRRLQNLRDEEYGKTSNVNSGSDVINSSDVIKSSVHSEASSVSSLKGEDTHTLKDVKTNKCGKTVDSLKHAKRADTLHNNNNIDGMPNMENRRADHDQTDRSKTAVSGNMDPIDTAEFYDLSKCDSLSNDQFHQSENVNVEFVELSKRDMQPSSKRHYERYLVNQKDNEYTEKNNNYPTEFVQKHNLPSNFTNLLVDTKHAFKPMTNAISNVESSTNTPVTPQRKGIRLGLASLQKTSKIADTESTQSKQDYVMTVPESTRHKQESVNTVPDSIQPKQEYVNTVPDTIQHKEGYLRPKQQYVNAVPDSIQHNHEYVVPNSIQTDNEYVDTVPNSVLTSDNDQDDISVLPVRPQTNFMSKDELQQLMDDITEAANKPVPYMFEDYPVDITRNPSDSLIEAKPLVDTGSPKRQRELQLASQISFYKSLGNMLLNRPALHRIVETCVLCSIRILRQDLGLVRIKECPYYEGKRASGDNYCIRPPTGKRQEIGPSSVFLPVSSRSNSMEDLLEASASHMTLPTIEILEHSGADGENSSLQNGDFIIEINGCFTLTKTTEDVNAMFCKCSGNVNITVARPKRHSSDSSKVEAEKQKEIETLQSKLQTAEQEVSRHLGSLAELRHAVNERDLRMRKLEDKLFKRQNRSTSMEKELREKESKVLDWMHEANRRDCDLSRLKVENKHKQDRIEYLERMLSKHQPGFEVYNQPVPRTSDFLDLDFATEGEISAV